jgi:hypothetical protein
MVDPAVMLPDASRGLPAQGKKKTDRIGSVLAASRAGRGPASLPGFTGWQEFIT